MRDGDEGMGDKMKTENKTTQGAGPLTRTNTGKHYYTGIIGAFLSNSRFSIKQRTNPVTGLIGPGT